MYFRPLLQHTFLICVSDLVSSVFSKPKLNADATKLKVLHLENSYSCVFEGGLGSGIKLLEQNLYRKKKSNYTNPRSQIGGGEKMKSSLLLEFMCFWVDVSYGITASYLCITRKWICRSVASVHQANLRRNVKQIFLLNSLCENDSPSWSLLLQTFLW